MKILYTPRPKSAEDWERDVLTWLRSGLSKAQFCRQHDLDYQRFHYWVSKHEQNRVSKLVPLDLSHFAQENGSQKENKTDANGVLRVRAGAFVLEISQTVDEGRLISALRALKAVM